MKNEEFDTSWFDLKKYDKLKDIDLNDWISLFEIRNTARLHTDMGGDFYFRLVTDPVSDWFMINNDYLYPFDTFSVKSTSIAELAVIQKSNKLKNSLAIFDELMDSEFNRHLRKHTHLQEQQAEHWQHIRSPINSLIEEGQMSFVTVNLQASDEQIMGDFRHWLTEYRKFTKIEQPRKKFTNKDLSRWYEYRILPYMDLTMIAKLQNKTISYPKIASLIFPDEYEVDRVERIKKTTKIEAEKIIKLFSTSWES